MTYYRSARSINNHYYRAPLTPVQKNAVMQRAANGVHVGMSSPQPLAQLLGAPVRSTTQAIKDKILSVMSPEDMVAFKDMMARVQSVLSDEDVQEVLQLAPAPAVPELPDHDAEMATDNWQDDPPGINPGYDAIDREMAVRAVIAWTERLGQFVPGESGLRMESPYIASKVLDITVEPCWPGVPSMLSAMLGGATQRPPKHYLVSDGRMSYSITPPEIQEYRDHVDEITMDPPTTSSILGSSGSWLSRSNLTARVHDDVPWDPADVITGLSYDEIAAEREELERLKQVAQQMTIVRDTVARSLTNKLTGVPDPVDVAQTLVDAGVNVEVLQDLAAQHGMGNGLSLANAALQASGSAVTLAAAPKMTAVYTPSVALTPIMDLPAIVAEAKRTLDFTLDHFHYKDSEMSLALIEMIELVDGFVPNSDQDLLDTKRMVIAEVVGVHAVLAVPVALAPRPLHGPVSSFTIGSTSGGLTSATTSATLMTNPYITVGAYQGVASGPWKTVVEFGDGDAFDRSFKLAPNHVYQLPDGSTIEVDATGNFTIHDQDAKITYRAARMREFNRYINGSDLIGEFIESLGALGASQQQAAKSPIELFIRWLIFKAAEADHEEPPADVPPLSSADFAPLDHATSA